MKNCLSRHLMILAACASLLLSACLPDSKDPADTSDTGKLSAAFYAAGLGNVAVQAQNAVVGKPDWFKSQVGLVLTLADFGITPDVGGAVIKVAICPTGSGTQVRQISWIDGRGDNGQFSLKGVGTNVGAISGALHGRVSAAQIGAFNGGATLSMADGTNMDIPASCTDLNIPSGAPVVAFTIDRPAAPTTELTRLEYRSQDCAPDPYNEHPRRGTQVQKRLLTYDTTGVVTIGEWSPESMGGCIDDVDVSVTKDPLNVGGASTDLTNFANVALKTLLSQQLKMDCGKTTVQKMVNGQLQGDAQVIDTCKHESGGSNIAMLTDNNAGAANDKRTLACNSQSIYAPLSNFNISGVTTASRWTSGLAHIQRLVNGRAITNKDAAGNAINAAGDANRAQWIGTDINCAGDETFTVQCSQIPGAPALEPQQSGSRVRYDGATFGWGYTYASTKLLNKPYFTGTYMYQNGGTSVKRPIAATSWGADATALTPEVTRENWSIDSNQCVWAKRVMYVDCPDYNPAQQGTWTATEGYPGFRPMAIVDFPTESITNASAWLFTGWQQRGELPMHSDSWWALSGWGYGYQYPNGYYEPPYVRRQFIGNSQTTLLNQNGVLIGYRPQLSNNNTLQVVQDGFAEPLRCGRDEQYTYNVPVYVTAGPNTAPYTYTEWTPVTVTTYRQFSGYSYNQAGAWSLPQVQVTSAYGAWGSVAAVPAAFYRNDTYVWDFNACVAYYGYSTSCTYSENGASCTTAPYYGCCNQFYPGDPYCGQGAPGGGTSPWTGEGAF